MRVQVCEVTITLAKIIVIHDIVPKLQVYQEIVGLDGQLSLMRIFMIILIKRIFQIFYLLHVLVVLCI